MKSLFLDCDGKRSATPLCPASSTELPLVFTRDRSRNRMSEAHVPRKTENYGRLGETPLFRRPAADTAALQTVRKRERNDLVSGAMIRPEVFAVEGQRATRKRYGREVFDLRCFLTEIESRNRPALAILLGPAQDVDHSVHECVAGNLCTNVDLAQNVAICVQFQNSMLIPLTQVKTFSVVTE